jgi:hypothetical protein
MIGSVANRHQVNATGCETAKNAQRQLARGNGDRGLGFMRRVLFGINAWLGVMRKP